MASTYTPLGVELMATGENAGTWGTKTNNNLNLFEQLTGGYLVQTLNTAGTGVNTTALTVADGALTGTAQARVIVLGSEAGEAITGNKIVTIPLDIENTYFIKNSTTGAYTVQFKYASGSGDTITWSTTDKGWKIISATGNDGTNPDVSEVVIDTVATPGGSDKQIQFNNNGAFGGITMGTNGQLLSTDGTTASFVDNTAASTGKAIAMAIVFG